MTVTMDSMGAAALQLLQHGLAELIFLICPSILCLKCNISALIITHHNDNKY